MNDYNVSELSLIGNVNYLLYSATLDAARGVDSHEIRRTFDRARELVGDFSSRRTRETLYRQIKKAETCTDGSLF